MPCQRPVLRFPCLLLATAAATVLSSPSALPGTSSCGAAPAPLNASAPNALLLGDSISLGFGVSPTDTGYGYGLNVAKLLGGPYPRTFATNSTPAAGAMATVQHGGGFGSNGGSSANANACIEHWLAGKAWDVVTLNFGLHDCQDPSGKVDAAGYSKNLRAVLTAARSAAGRVIFVTTTPFHRYHNYSMACVVQLNAAARQLIAAINAEPAPTGRAAAAAAPIEVADLFAAVEAFCGANYTACPIQLNGNLHFSTAWTPPWSTDRTTGDPLQTGPRPSGQQYTGLIVARAIQRLVPASKIVPPVLPPHAAGHTGFGLAAGRPGQGAGAAGSPCGLPPSALNTTIPNVLIIGDSVSDSGSGYGPNVRAMLETSTGNGNTVGNNPRNDGPLAVVQHNGGWSPARGANEQASNSANGIACIDHWVGTNASLKWDVISFNFGIHDCWAPQRVNATAYKANLATIYDAAHAALAPGGKVVWTSTTPIATNCGSTKAPRGPCYGVAPECVAEYNQIAADLLGGKPDVVINDVYNAVLGVCGAKFETCTLQHQHDVHPSGPGKQFLALELAATIAPYLNRRLAP